MATYTLNCDDCKKKYNVITKDADLLPNDSLKCPSCKSDKTILIEFYINDSTRIKVLADEIKSLVERAENLDDLDYASQDEKEMLRFN